MCQLTRRHASHHELHCASCPRLHLCLCLGSSRPSRSNGQSWRQHRVHIPNSAADYAIVRRMGAPSSPTIITRHSQSFLVFVTQQIHPCHCAQEAVLPCGSFVFAAIDKRRPLTHPHMLKKNAHTTDACDWLNHCRQKIPQSWPTCHRGATDVGEKTVKFVRKATFFNHIQQDSRHVHWLRRTTRVSSHKPAI